VPAGGQRSQHKAQVLVGWRRDHHRVDRRVRDGSFVTVVAAGSLEQSIELCGTCRVATRKATVCLAIESREGARVPGGDPTATEEGQRERFSHREFIRAAAGWEAAMMRADARSDIAAIVSDGFTPAARGSAL